MAFLGIGLYTSELRELAAMVSRCYRIRSHMGESSSPSWEEKESEASSPQGDKAEGNPEMARLLFARWRSSIPITETIDFPDAAQEAGRVCS